MHQGVHLDLNTNTITNNLCMPLKSLIMLGYIFSLLLLINFCNLSNSKISNVYRIEPDNNDKVSNTSLLGKYHSESPVMCSGFGQYNYFGFNAKEKKCRIHTCYPTHMSGAEDGWIYYISTNPGCGDDWLEYNGHCYFHGTTQLSWTKALMACEDIFSQLVEIEDIEESVWLAATFIFKDTCSQSDYFHCTAWTGGNDILMEGNYGWHHSNSSTAFINWHVEQPSGRHDGREEDCVEMMSDGKWNDRNCNDRTWFICEKIKC